MSWIIVGLGNPGEEYKNTRHNVGRMALEYFARLSDLPEMKEDRKNKMHISRGAVGKAMVVLVAPDTYMNKSGSAVAKYVKPARPNGRPPGANSIRTGSGGSQKAAERLVVIYDDLDLPLGTMKISFDRGSGGHKGLESVIRAVKTKRFARIRIGISPSTVAGTVKKPSGEKKVLDFILAKFKKDELDLLRRLFKKSTEALRTIISDGPQRAMNEYN